MKYYGLWYYCDSFGARTAHAISENPESLLPLHLESIKNPDSPWYHFAHNVSEVKVEPVECYTYNVETKTIEPYNDSHKAEEHDFYAFNTLLNDRFGCSFYDEIDMKLVDSDGEPMDTDDYDDFNKGEILVYLSKKNHGLWRECSDNYRTSDVTMDTDPQLPMFFYTDWPSDSPVEVDVYYEEGIMNA